MAAIVLQKLHCISTKPVQNSDKINPSHNQTLQILWMQLPLRYKIINRNKNNATTESVKRGPINAELHHEILGSFHTTAETLQAQSRVA